MNGDEIKRIVDAIHRDKSIDKEIVFEGIEQAILSAARKHFSEEEVLDVRIDRDTGEPSLTCDGALLEPDLIGDLLGRISAQTAKQVMIQRIREAERDSHYDQYLDLKSQLVTGAVTRVDRGTVIVNLGKVEAILPRSEQINKESYRVGDRVRAIVLDVKKAGSRVRVILSRTHADFVRRLFEVEIPEVNDRIIETRSIAREAGHRSKVAVSSYDTTIDCVGACVGVRGARIRGIVEELNGERIDIVRWNDSLQLLVPNALQPAEVEDVILCPMLGKVIILVREDQLSLAIGRRGQNVRLASKLCGWDINVMTQESLDEQLDISIEAFSVVPKMPSDLVENLVSQGFFTFDDLSVIEPDELLEMSGLTQEDVDAIIEFADVESLRIEQEEREAAIAKKLNPPPAEPPAVSTADGSETKADDSADDSAVEQAAPEPQTEQVDGEASEAESEVTAAETEAAAEQDDKSADVSAGDRGPAEETASSNSGNADDKSDSSTSE
ncbi:MAG: transcription termination factor NusA [Fuerstiella sp.]|nr:transcription termination factor NusA [Fuerstiella sp.]MCP4508002.1 transcription termination factor NusA [Fuerstiella sp.]